MSQSWLQGFTYMLDFALIHRPCILEKLVTLFKSVTRVPQLDSFCEYRSTCYVNLSKTKEIKDRKQNNSKQRLFPSYQNYKAFRYLQKDPSIDNFRFLELD